MMCGIDDAISWIETKTLKTDDMPMKIVNRLRYIRDKDTGIKPKFHKGHCGKKYDYYTCGNCGATILEIGYNYCPNCGFAILWNSCRCLTGTREGRG